MSTPMPDLQDVFDAWWDDQPYLGDDNYDREFAAFRAGWDAAGRVAAAMETGVRAQGAAAERERIRELSRIRDAEYPDYWGNPAKFANLLDEDV